MLLDPEMKDIYNQLVIWMCNWWKRFRCCVKNSTIFLNRLGSGFGYYMDFMSGHHIDTYNSGMYLNYYSENDVLICGQGGNVGIGTTSRIGYPLVVNGSNRFVI